MFGAHEEHPRRGDQGGPEQAVRFLRRLFLVGGYGPGVHGDGEDSVGDGRRDELADGQLLGVKHAIARMMTVSVVGPRING